VYCWACKSRSRSRTSPFEVNLPEFLSEGLQCVDFLEKVDAGGRFNLTADCRLGMAYPDCLSASQFASALSSCIADSVEVFWRSAECTRATPLTTVEGRGGV
jgi:hypothetical protein